MPSSQAVHRAPLSSRQRRILDVILEHVYAHGYPPSVRELGDAVGLASTSSVAHQLQVLEARGYLRRMPGTSRGLTVVDYERDTTSQVRVAALASAIEHYAGPPDDTVPVLQFWLDELTGNDHAANEG